MRSPEKDLFLSTFGNRLGVLLKAINHYGGDPKRFLREYYNGKCLSSLLAENILGTDLDLINFLNSECRTVSGSRYVYDYDKFEAEARRRLKVT